MIEHISTNSYKEKLNLNMNQLNRLFSPSFKKVKGCILITEKSVEELENCFENAMEMYMDKTGYEASNTETRINDYFDNELSMEAGTQIALMVIEIWSLRVKSLEPQSKFCFILCSDDNHVEIRFHKVRRNEISWLAEDIESYEDGAVGYVHV